MRILRHKMPIKIISYFSILLLFPLGGCSFLSEEWTEEEQKTVRVAKKMHDQEEYRSAYKLYQQILDHHPSSLEAIIGTSKALYALRDYNQALYTLKQGEKYHGDHRDLKLEIGKAYLAMNDPHNALKAYQVVLKEDHKMLRPLNGVAVAYDLLKNHEEAQKWYHEALSVEPHAHKTLSNLGLSYALGGKADLAINTLSPLVQSTHTTMRDRHNLAIAYGMQGNIKKAIQIFSVDLEKTAVEENIRYIQKLKEEQKKRGLSSERKKERKIVAPQANSKDVLVLKKGGETLVSSFVAKKEINGDVAKKSPVGENSSEKLEKPLPIIKEKGETGLESIAFGDGETGEGESKIPEGEYEKSPENISSHSPHEESFSPFSGAKEASPREDSELEEVEAALLLLN